jgi:hypothetical protein
MFCDFLTDAYYENDEDGRKWEHLMEVLKAKLPAEVFSEVFAGSFTKAHKAEMETKFEEACNEFNRICTPFGLARVVPAEGHSTEEYKPEKDKHRREPS